MSDDIGLYLKTGAAELVPVHTSGTSDYDLLRDYLRRWDVPGVEVADE